MIGDIGGAIVEYNAGEIAYPLGAFGWIVVAIGVGVPLWFFGWRWVLRFVLYIGGMYVALLGAPIIAMRILVSIAPAARGTLLTYIAGAGGLAFGCWFLMNIAPKILDAVERLIELRKPPR